MGASNRTAKSKNILTGNVCQEQGRLRGRNEQPPSGCLRGQGPGGRRRAWRHPAPWPDRCAPDRREPSGCAARETRCIPALAATRYSYQSGASQRQATCIWAREQHAAANAKTAKQPSFNSDLRCRWLDHLSVAGIARTRIFSRRAGRQYRLTCFLLSSPGATGVR